MKSLPLVNNHTYAIPQHRHPIVSGVIVSVYFVSRDIMKSELLLGVGVESDTEM